MQFIKIGKTKLNVNNVNNIDIKNIWVDDFNLNIMFNGNRYICDVELTMGIFKKLQSAYNGFADECICERIG
jgi:hypothetical protein